MIHNGKIGRLPRKLRDQLNHRLDDGENSITLLQWLNELPEVKATLAKEFGGEPVSKQNLSAWRAGGFAEWQRQQQACAAVRELAERHAALKQAGGDELAETFAGVLAAELLEVVTRLLAVTGDDETRLQRIQSALHEVNNLRRRNHQAKKLQDEITHRRRIREQAEMEYDEKEERRDWKQHKKQLLAQLRIPVVAQIHGGGEKGRLMARLEHCIRFDEPFESVVDKYNAIVEKENAEYDARMARMQGKEPATASQGESSQVKAN